MASFTGVGLLLGSSFVAAIQRIDFGDWASGGMSEHMVKSP
jgi:hypothetical protein